MGSQGQATQGDIQIKIPSFFSSVNCESDVQKDQWAYHFDEGERRVTVTIGRLQGNQVLEFRINGVLERNLTEKEIRRSLFEAVLKYEVNSKELSRLGVASLNIDNPGKESPSRWIRYLTISSNTAIRF